MATASPPARAAEWTPERIAAERKRIKRHTWAILAVIVLVLFGLMDSRYEQVQGASGRRYRVVDAGRRFGTDWSGSYVRYLSSADDQAGRDREIIDLSRAFSDFAERNGDEHLEVAAARRRFRYGYFHVDAVVTTRYRREGGRWRLE